MSESSPRDGRKGDTTNKPVEENLHVRERRNDPQNDFQEEPCRPPIDFGPLKHVDWAASPIGEMRSWPPCLKALASLLVTLPYAAAIFWGQDFVMIHNWQWELLAGDRVGQGRPAGEMFNHEVIGRLRATLKGQVHDTGSANFFRENKQDVKHLQTLLHPLCGEGQGIEGVMAQFISRTDASISSFKTKPDKGQADSEALPDANSAGNLDAANFLGSLPIDGRLLFQKFAHMIPTGLAILDSNAEALFVNDLFYKLTTHPGENPFRAWPQSIHPDDYEQVMTEYKKAFQLDQIMSVQFRSSGPNDFDSPSWRLFMMRPISDVAPVAQDGFLCAIIDITSLKAAELYQKQIATEAVERKKQQEKFMDMISHEIRNPLSAIMHSSEGIIESLKETPETGDAVEHKGVRVKSHVVNASHVQDIFEAAETILFCVHHQKNIVDDILSFSKLDAMMLSLTPSPFQPDQKFAQYLRIFQPELREKKIEIQYSIDPSYNEGVTDWVQADMVRINQVLVNLMTNAIKFTARKNGKRRITVSLGASLKRPTSYPPSVVFFHDDEESHRMDATMKPEWGEGDAMYLLVAVRDTGIGISDEAQARLFERFRQATPKTEEQYGGSGLGLFISRKLCQLHGGDIGVSSKEGSGSTFGFFFKVRKMRDAPNMTQIERRNSEIAKTSLLPKDVPIVDERTPSSLVDPPTEKNKEVRPEPSEDERYRKSARILKVDDKIERREEEQQEKKRQQAKDEEKWRGGENRTGGELESPGNILATPKEEKHSMKYGPAERAAGVASTKESKNPTSELTDRDSNREESDQPRAGKEFGSHFKEIYEEALLENDSPKEEKVGKMSPEGENPTESQPGLAEGSENATKSSHLHVLLVEDNKINLRVMKKQLQAKGLRVSTAGNGKEAVDLYTKRFEQQSSESHHESQEDSEETTDFTCILMDQEMPIMDGNAATKSIRAHEKERSASHIPILGISANARNAQRDGMFDAGMDDVISKPFKIDELVQHIKDLVERAVGAR